MKEVDVSFILNSYNFEPFIKEAINSLLNQNGNYSVELIIVDDNSNDQSAKIIESVDDPRIKFIRHEENMGAATSINEAFRIARGKYIARLDGDDEWYPWFLEKTIPLLEENSDIGLVYGDISVIDSESNLLKERSYIKDYGSVARKERVIALLKDYDIPAPSIIGKREAWQVALPIPSHVLYCDFHLTLNILLDWEIKYLDYPIARYRLHSTNMHTVSMMEKKAEKSIFFTISSLMKSQSLLFTQQEVNSIYQTRFRDLGDSYFGMSLPKEARRCYKKAFNWSLFWSDKRYRRLFLVSMISIRLYTYSKMIIKKCFSLLW